MCDTSSLDPLLSEYGALLRSATDLMDHYLGLKRRNRDIKPIKVGPRKAGCWVLAVIVMLGVCWCRLWRER